MHGCICCSKPKQREEEDRNLTGRKTTLCGSPAEAKKSPEIFLTRPLSMYVDANSREWRERVHAGQLLGSTRSYLSADTKLRNEAYRKKRG